VFASAPSGLRGLSAEALASLLLQPRGALGDVPPGCRAGDSTEARRRTQQLQDGMVVAAQRGQQRTALRAPGGGISDQ
jgi:hypothetical protein